MNIKILQENMRRFKTKNLIKEQNVSSYPEIAPAGEEDIPGATETAPPEVTELSDTFISNEPLTVWRDLQAGTEAGLGESTWKIVGPNGKLLGEWGEDGKLVPGGKAYAFLLGNNVGRKRLPFLYFLKDAYGVELKPTVETWALKPNAMGAQFGGIPAGPNGEFLKHPVRDKNGNITGYTVLSQEEAKKEGYKVNKTKLKLTGGKTPNIKMYAWLNRYLANTIANLDTLKDDWPSAMRVKKHIQDAMKTYASDLKVS